MRGSEKRRLSRLENWYTRSLQPLHPGVFKACSGISCIIRVLFIAVLGCAAFFLPTLGHSSGPYAGLVGVLVGAGVVLFEFRIKEVSLKALDRRGAFGSVLGILGAYRLISLVACKSAMPDSTDGPIPSIGAAGLDDVLRPDRRRGQGRHAQPGGSGRVVRRRKGLQEHVQDPGHQRHYRRPDRRHRFETGFIDGAIVIPQFVLRELQLVADSSDSMKRNRGRRGLDILQRPQKMPELNVQILEDDFPAVREVDMKLIELAKVYTCKIVTNDFNLNKVAQLHGVDVLNINELANAMKPVVLPGETMRVFILKEGKEYNQGVAYLDDGTMVVVDNARKMISKTIDIAVTSVLQTTAGKMIFGRFDDRVHAVHDRVQDRALDKTREPASATGSGT